MTLKLVSHDDPVLATAAGSFDFSDQPCDPIDLVSHMADVMFANNGLSLAANQVGIPYRAIVVLSDELIPMFNPKIVGESEEIILLDEINLNFPSISIKIKRPRKVRVRYTEPNGNIKTESFDGIVARSIQSAISNLDGRTFFHDASKLRRDAALKKWQKLLKSAKPFVSHGLQNYVNL